MPAIIFSTVKNPELYELINAGGVGVLPTDTVYGLVCSARNPAAAARLYSLKLRGNKPGTIIAANIDELVSLGLKRRYLKAVEQFWPGAVSVILPAPESLHYLSQSQPSLAMRVVGDQKINQLLNKTGPLLTTSANLPGQPPAQIIAEAQKYFADKIDFYVDGGDLSGRPPSTIIKIIDDAIEVVRRGAVKI
ncbi:MAG: L-threonylcarbamoyladenylate synthase [Candidatus Saccharimonadales bacterium]